MQSERVECSSAARKSPLKLLAFLPASRVGSRVTTREGAARQGCSGLFQYLAPLSRKARQRGFLFRLTCLNGRADTYEPAQAWHTRSASSTITSLANRLPRVMLAFNALHLLWGIGLPRRGEHRKRPSCCRCCRKICGGFVAFGITRICRSRANVSLTLGHKALQFQQLPQPGIGSRQSARESRLLRPPNHFRAQVPTPV